MTFEESTERIRAASSAVREDARKGEGEARRLGADTGDVVSELRELARREMDLARAEAADAGSAMAQAAMWGAAAAVLGVLVLAYLALAGVYGLTRVVDDWLAALIVSGVLLLLTAGAGLLARSRVQALSAPGKRTAASVRRDMAWVRELMKPSSASRSNGA